MKSTKGSRGIAPDGSPWLLLSEAASLLGVPRERLWTLLREKKIKGLYSPYEGRHLLPESACLKFIQEHSGYIAGGCGKRVSPEPWSHSASGDSPTDPPAPRATA